MKSCLKGTGLEGVAEGLRDPIHVPLYPSFHGVLHLARVVLHPEALALTEDRAKGGANGILHHVTASEYEGIFKHLKQSTRTSL